MVNNKENSDHAVCALGCNVSSNNGNSKKVIALDKDGSIKYRFGSLMSAVRFMSMIHNIKTNSVKNVMNADDKYYFHSFCIINNEPPDLKYDCITDDPTQKATYIRCKDCGELFSLFWHEVEWFKKQNLHTPKMCKSCRNKRNRSAYNG